VIHEGMPFDPIQGQGQGHGGPTFANMVDIKVYPPRVHVIKRLMINSDTPRQYLNFNRT